MGQAVGGSSYQDIRDAADLEQAVFLALGAASMCWDAPNAAGVFRSDQARQVGEALIEYVTTRAPHLAVRR